jgi:predicted acetyltransferase
MTIEIRACTPDELPRFLQVLGTAFGNPIPETEAPQFRDKLPVDRTWAGFDDGAMVSTAGAFPFEMTITGGRTVKACGVTMVGALPTHRRQGTMRRLMRALLDQARELKEPVAILWASEEGIYQRFGYGLASNQGHISIERDRARFLGDPQPVGRTRLISLEEARGVLPAIYEDVRLSRPGMLARSEAWWRSHTLYDSERYRDGAGPLLCSVLSMEGEDRAYALYRNKGDWAEDITPNGSLRVNEVVATSPVAYREMWRYLFSIDLIHRINAYYLPSDLPLTLMLSDPRRLRFAKSDSLWLRIVDLVEALEARTYATDGQLGLSISDEFCPWNAGEWTLRVEGGSGKVTPGGRAEITLDIAALAAVYLGEFSFSDLARSLRAESRSDDAIEKADAMFRTAVAPWCVENF